MTINFGIFTINSIDKLYVLHLSNRQMKCIINSDTLEYRSPAFKKENTFFADIIIEAAKAAHIFPTEDDVDQTSLPNVEIGDQAQPVPIGIVNPIVQQREDVQPGAAAAPEVTPPTQGTRASSRGTARDWHGIPILPPSTPLPPATVATTSTTDDLQGPVLHITDPRTDTTAWETAQTNEGYYYVLYTQAPIPTEEGPATLDHIL